METVDILEQLFDPKLMKILRVFFSNPSQEFYLREISKMTGVPVASVFRIMAKLVELKIIKQKPIKKFKLYYLGDNEHTRFLGQLIKKEKQAIEVFVTRAKFLPGLQQIILQGKEENYRANLILIGEKINKTEVKKLCGEIKKEFDFSITELILGREQFEQMDRMGLYPGKKKVLYSK